MIKSYRNKTTEQASNGKFGKTISPDIRKRVVMRLERLAAATTLDDLRVPPSHMLEALKGIVEASIAFVLIANLGFVLNGRMVMHTM